MYFMVAKLQTVCTVSGLPVFRLYSAFLVQLLQVRSLLLPVKFCLLSLFKECSYPNGLLQSNVTLLGNKSFLIFACDFGFGLYGSTTSQCVSGEWIPNPDSVTCRSFGITIFMSSLYPSFISCRCMPNKWV